MSAQRKEKNMQSVTRATLIIGLVFLAALRTSASPTQDRVTILYDAFGKPSGMKKDWGYSALVEYGGKHILFDTGNNAEIFAQNVKVSGVDLKKLDFAVISHRHGDHTGGIKENKGQSLLSTVRNVFLKTDRSCHRCCCGESVSIISSDPSLPRSGIT